MRFIKRRRRNPEPVQIELNIEALSSPPTCHESIWAEPARQHFSLDRSKQRATRTMRHRHDKHRRQRGRSSPHHALPSMEYRR